LVRRGGFGLTFVFFFGAATGFGRPRAVYDQNLADVLDGRRVQRRADFAEELRTRRMLGGHHADFDELVADEIAVDFVHHRGREPAIADHDHGMERVRACAQ
jgi:hypothetical protein